METAALNKQEQNFWMKELINRVYSQAKNRPLAVMMTIYQLIMVFLVILKFPQVQYHWYWLGFNFLAMVYLATTRWSWVNITKTLCPVVIIPINFTELHYLVHVVHPVDYDNLLIRLDYFIFGVHPTVWLEQFTYPLLTEILQIVYASFYFLPVGLAVFLLVKDRSEKGNFFVYMITYGFYISYLAYFLIPAIGPRFTLNYLQSIQLHGVWIMSDLHHLLNSLESIQRDAFPSGHTAMTLITLFYAWRLYRPYGYFMVPVTIMMIYSTVYLRYHYAIDVLAGVVLFVLVILSGEYLYKKLRN